MHHSMQQRGDDLAEFYELSGRPTPAPQPLFQAVAKGKAWHVVEIATGKTKGFRFSYKATLHFVNILEAGALLGSDCHPGSNRLL